MRNLFFFLSVLQACLGISLAAGHSQQGASPIPGMYLMPRFWVGALCCAAGLLIFRSRRLSRGFRLVSLTVIFFLFAVVQVLPLGGFAAGMGLHPSPMCVVTKPLLFYRFSGFVPLFFIGVLLFIAFLSIIGSKLFCGWICPLGAAQELVHRISMPSKWKKKLSFKITNSLRAAILAAYLAIAFIAGINIYDYFNPFHFFHWGFALYSTVVFGIVMAAALFLFRPFCYLACPIGMLTWLLEPVAIFKLKVDNSRCNDCRLCSKKCACPAVPAVLAGRKVRPDCCLCGMCVEKCPEGALRLAP